jgi:uncharacterized membrane protein
MLSVELPSRTALSAMALAATLWVVLLGFATWNSTRRSPGIAASVGATGIYAAAALVCHQEPERSFHWRGSPLPVCGRCLGIYLAAAIGLWLAAFPWKRRLATPHLGVTWLGVAAGLNLSTLVIEWLGGPASNGIRATAGAVLGATAAFSIAALVRADESDEVN